MIYSGIPAACGPIAIATFHLWPCGLIGHVIRPLPVNQGRVPQRARILKQSIPEFDS
jgi:hypothetical protein